LRRHLRKGGAGTGSFPEVELLLMIGARTDSTIAFASLAEFPGI
jgi:hypothetical protein